MAYGWQAENFKGDHRRLAVGEIAQVYDGYPSEIARLIGRTDPQAGNALRQILEKLGRFLN